LNKTLLNIEIQSFINSNLETDVVSLLLKGIPFPSVETKAVIEQIEAKKRCKVKLPTWFTSSNIYYPNKLNIEQTSSEATAKYKSLLINGDSIIDLTGGFGVDCFYFSKYFKAVTHCEINRELFEIVAHNYSQLNLNTIVTVNSDGLEYIESSKKRFDWIYIDPSRRHDSKGKVFNLKDCLPNVPKHLETYFEKSDNILIKTSPLLDLSVGISELKHIKYIHIVAVNNDVKELLWLLEKSYSEDITIETVNLKPSNKAQFSFKLHTEPNADVKYSLPLKYLYEPNAAIMKSGAFNSVSSFYKLFKLHKHSHLYTSQQLIDFPGRRFRIEKILPYNKKIIKKESIRRANITTRNFPESVQQIRKRFDIKDGGNTFLFFSTNKSDSKIVVICSKIV